MLFKQVTLVCFFSMILPMYGSEHGGVLDLVYTEGPKSEMGNSRKNILKDAGHLDT